MSNLDNQKSAKQLLNDAARACDKLRLSWLERLLTFFEVRRRNRLHLEARVRCRKGEHDFGNFTLINKVTVYQKSTDKMSCGIKYVYRGNCIHCTIPLIRTLYDYAKQG